LKKLEVSPRAPAVLDRIEAIRRTEGPCPHPSNASGFLPFEQSIWMSGKE
jgi:hypothetical protein